MTIIFKSSTRQLFEQSNMLDTGDPRYLRGLRAVDDSRKTRDHCIAGGIMLFLLRIIEGIIDYTIPYA